MSEGIITALISAGGVFLSVSVSAVTYCFTRRFDYHRLFAETVSKDRMDWINVWRQSISEFLAIAEEINFNSNISSEMGVRYKTAKNMVLSRLNLEETEHIIMERFIKDLDPQSDNFARRRDAILELERRILKAEWERVKRESKGK